MESDDRHASPIPKLGGFDQLQEWHGFGDRHDSDPMPYSGAMARRALPVRLGPQGRLVVPVELRRELGLDDGAELAIRTDGRRLILEPRSEVLRRLRGRFAVAGDVNLVDELAADREDEARRGDEA